MMEIKFKDVILYYEYDNFFQTDFYIHKGDKKYRPFFQFWKIKTKPIYHKIFSINTYWYDLSRSKQWWLEQITNKYNEYLERQVRALEVLKGELF